MYAVLVYLMVYAGCCVIGIVSAAFVFPIAAIIQRRFGLNREVAASAITGCGILTSLIGRQLENRWLAGVGGLCWAWICLIPIVGIVALVWTTCERHRSRS